MAATILRKDLGEAGAFLGDKSGPYADLLRTVLEALARAFNLNALQATPSVATIAQRTVFGEQKLYGLKTKVGTTGTAGSTTVQVHKNGSSVGELTTANTEADGTIKTLDLNVDLADGDLVELKVTAIPTAGANISVEAQISPLDIEQ